MKGKVRAKREGGKVPCQCAKAPDVRKKFIKGIKSMIPEGFRKDPPTRQCFYIPKKVYG